MNSFKKERDDLICEVGTEKILKKLQKNAQIEIISKNALIYFLTFQKQIHYRKYKRLLFLKNTVFLHFSFSEITLSYQMPLNICQYKFPSN